VAFHYPEVVTGLYRLRTTLDAQRMRQPWVQAVGESARSAPRCCDRSGRAKSGDAGAAAA
jgi:hypothetical protein